MTPTDEEHQRQCVRHLDADQHQDATQCRPGDGRHLSQRRVDRHGPREEAGRSQVREERLARRLAEGAHHAEEHHHPEDRRRIGHAGQRQRQQRGGADGRQEVGQQLDAAAVVSVRDVAGGQDEHDEGQELGQRHQAEIERVAGGEEDLPADGHRQDLGGHADDEAGGQVAAQVGVAEDRPAVPTVGG